MRASSSSRCRINVSLCRFNRRVLHLRSPQQELPLPRRTQGQSGQRDAKVLCARTRWRRRQPWGRAWWQGRRREGRLWWWRTRRWKGRRWKGRGREGRGREGRRLRWAERRRSWRRVWGTARSARGPRELEGGQGIEGHTGLVSCNSVSLERCRRDWSRENANTSTRRVLCFSLCLPLSIRMDSPSPVADSNDSDTLSYTSARSGADDDALADALNLLVIQQPLPLPSTIPPLPVQPETLRDPQAVSAHSSDGPDSPTRPQSVPSSPLLPPLLPANLAAIPPPAVPSPSQTPRPSPSRRTAVIFQEACTKHRYSRNTDIGSIVERPERIRAVKTGVASAWARLESRSVAHGGSKWEPAAAGVEDLDALMLGLAIKDNKGKGKEVLGGPFDILFSTAILPVNDPALLFIHPLPNLPPTDATPPPPRPPSPPAPAPAKLSTPGRQPPSTPPSNKNLFLSHPIPASAPPKLASRKYDLLTPPAWPTQLQTLCRNAASAVLSPPYSEIPPHLPQGDLYLSEGSEEAIFGALGAVCEGVDRVVEGARSEDGGYDRAFVAIRPPGHVSGLRGELAGRS